MIDASSCNVGGKPIRPFGLVHGFQEGRIREAFFEKYPELARDLEKHNLNPGLIALLLDSLIDIDLLLQKPETPPESVQIQTSNSDSVEPKEFSAEQLYRTHA